MAPRTKARKLTTAKTVLKELKKWNAGDIKQYEAKLAAAKAAKETLDAATSDRDLKYAFTFCQIHQHDGEGRKPALETILNGSGPLKAALRDAKRRYKEIHGLRVVENEIVVLVEFPHNYRIMLFDSLKKEREGKKRKRK